MGKSTLLKVMAGLEQPSDGEAALRPGARVGILLQEPPLGDDKTVLGNVEQGVADTLALLRRYSAVSAVISAHDRWFLDRIATHILAWEGDDDPGQWLWFEGNFEAYHQNKIHRLGVEAVRPHRVTYRKLTRD